MSYQNKIGNARAWRDYQNRDIEMEVLVEAVKSYAMDHYDDGGWDYVIETFSDEDIAKDIGKASTPEGAIEKVKYWADLLGDRRADVTAEIY